MGKLPKALFMSLAAHGLLAASLCFWLDVIPRPEAPSLELTAVEFSFAEEESAAEPVRPPPPETEPPPDPEPEPERRRDPEPEPEPDPEPDPEPEFPPEPELPPEPDPEPDLPEETPLPPELPPDPVPPPPEPEPPKPEPPPPPPAPAPEPPPPPQAAPKQARLDALPRPLKSIRPDYPKEARQRNEEGDVVLELSIDAKGRVEKASVAASSGYAELDAAAVRAAGRARFTPARSGGRAVASTARLTVNFRLSPAK